MSTTRKLSGHPLLDTSSSAQLYTGLLGSAFPLLAHATIASGSGAGKDISYLYLSNIIGSTLGSFLVGFVILVADESMDPRGSSESRGSMEKRLARTPIITDDNMGVEWR